LLNKDVIKKSQIFIIDDEPANVLFLERLFEWEGFTLVSGFTDPVEALEACRFAAPDIVLLDLQMPTMSGYEVLEQLREASSEGPFLPVLVFTADVNPESRKRALSMGATDFLTKPGDATEIALRVNNFLGMRHLHREVMQQKEVLEHKVQERTADLEASRMDVLHRLAKASECRDDDTGDHIHRVGELSCQIAMALSSLDCCPNDLFLAAPLHDVGKIGIPDSILLKPGRLTLEEFEVMKTHTQIGHQILSGSPSPVLQLAATIALTHHEKWDGSGYPKGLSGSDIPIAGRIVAVADVFDALTHSRPYKNAWPVEEAVSEIAKGSGSHFDPEVVNAFMSLNMNPGIRHAA
jgi:putative two-component system response regulator